MFAALLKKLRRRFLEMNRIDGQDKPTVGVKTTPPAFIRAKRLRDLCTALENGNDIPEDLAKFCAGSIKECLDGYGKPLIPKSTGKGGQARRQVRATSVAYLIEIKRLSRKEAIEQTASEYGVKSSTVDNDYRKLGQYYRELVRIRDNQKRICEEYPYLKDLLKAFKEPNGSRSLTDAQIDELGNYILAGQVQGLITRIEEGPIQRDLDFLEELLSESDE